MAYPLSNMSKKENKGGVKDKTTGIIALDSKYISRSVALFASTF
jgi:hypothetical protein